MVQAGMHWDLESEPNVLGLLRKLKQGTHSSECPPGPVHSIPPGPYLFFLFAYPTNFAQPILNGTILS